MKKIAIATATLLTAAAMVLPMAASAKPAAKPYKLPASYQAVYCYPGGTYWQAQIAAFPKYYAANNAYYLSQYGPGTEYCPN